MYPHMGFDYGLGLPGLGLLLVILFGALIVIGIALLLRQPGSAAPAAPAIDQRSQAQRILEERFARGEIDEAEFRARLEVLLGASSMTGSTAAATTAEPAWTTAAPRDPAPTATATPSIAPATGPLGQATSGANEGEDQ